MLPWIEMIQGSIVIDNVNVARHSKIYPHGRHKRRTASIVTSSAKAV